MQSETINCIIGEASALYYYYFKLTNPSSLFKLCLAMVTNLH